jgi:PAS domain S-box-containing protein
MHQQPTDPSTEVRRLQRCTNDLVSVLALPAVWSVSEPSRILETLLDALTGILDLDFLYARVRLDPHGAPIEALKTTQLSGRSYSREEIGQALNRWFGEDPQQWPEEVRRHLAGQEVSVFPIKMGIDGELGLIVAGSERVGFPEQTESLVLSVASNQAAIGLQQALRLSEQKRVASELDLRVAQRTAELAAANQVLRTEIAERKEIEKRFKSSEARYRVVVETASDAVVSLDESGAIILANPATKRVFGYNPEELIGKPLAVLMPEAMRRLHETGFKRYLETGARHLNWHGIELTGLRANGKEFPIEVSFGEMTEDRRKVFTGFIRDISEKKRAEEAILASERNLSLIINTMPVLAWSALPNGTVEFFNQRWLDYTGLSPEQAQGWGWTDAIHHDDLGQMSEYWQSIIVSGEPGEIEARLRRFDGNYRWFLFRADPMRDDSGAILKWYGTNTDIDDRRRAEEALRSRELNLLQITETIPEMLWSASPDGAIDYCNGRLLDYTGFSPEQVMSKGWIRLLHPDDVEPTSEVWKSCVKSGAAYRVEVRTFHAADNKYRWCVTSALPLLNEEGHIVKWHGTVVDMHDWKQAQEELRNTQAELARMMRVMTVGQLTASIAHEVSQPLSGIIMNASTCLRMLNGVPPNVDGARETAQRTIRDGKRATEVVTRLRTLLSKKQIRIERVDLNEAAREVIALLSDELQKNRVTVQQKFNDRLPAVKGDRVQLLQVLLNLLRNASDAMVTVQDRPRQLVIRTDADGNQATVFVQDSGVGFDPEITDRLFESFFTTKQEGMGIGLSLSRSIVEAHSGHLWATRNEGPGATFAFSIPCDSGLPIDGAFMTERDSLA